MCGWLCAIGLCFSADAGADALIPYMAVPWGQVFLLPIVILIEAAILYALLGGTVRAILYQSFLANLASTIVGALLYVATTPLFGESLFSWWFKGEFASERVRNACIALLFAATLCGVSWLVESWVIARLRNTGFAAVSRPSAWANLATYALLLALALWFQR